jgi:hypothetical protein
VMAGLTGQSWDHIVVTFDPQEIPEHLVGQSLGQLAAYYEKERLALTEHWPTKVNAPGLGQSITFRPLLAVLMELESGYGALDGASSTQPSGEHARRTDFYDACRRIEAEHGKENQIK